MNTYGELDEEENKILDEVFAEFGVNPKVWFTFTYGNETIQFDGELSLLEMKAFTEAMSRMQKRQEGEQSLSDKLIQNLSVIDSLGRLQS